MANDYVLTTNDGGDLAVRTVSATEASNVADTLSVITRTDDGKLAVRTVGGSSGDAHNKGYFATLAELQEAYPTGEAGDWAIVAESDTVYIWDDTQQAWVDTDQKGQVTSVNGQTGDVVIPAGSTYTAGNGISIDSNNEISVQNPVAVSSLGSVAVVPNVSSSSLYSIGSVHIGNRADTYSTGSVSVGQDANGGDYGVGIGSGASSSFGGISLGFGSSGAGGKFHIALSESDPTTYAVITHQYDLVNIDGTVPADRLASTTGLADGNYRLRLVMASGVPTLEWVAE